jgi:hypothetical protein
LKVADTCRRHARYRFTRTEIRQSRLGSSGQSMPELFNDGKTIVLTGSKLTCKGDDWPPPILILPTSFAISPLP